MIESSNVTARSVSFASIAVLTRVISKLAVSLRESVQTAQMRSSIALAVTSSGASFSAPNRKSRLRVRSARGTGGSLVGGSTHLPDSAAAGATEIAATAKTRADSWARNRVRMGGV